MRKSNEISELKWLGTKAILEQGIHATGVWLHAIHICSIVHHTHVRYEEAQSARPGKGSGKDAVKTMTADGKGTCTSWLEEDTALRRIRPFGKKG
jgi:hypothetical protein